MRGREPSPPSAFFLADDHSIMMQAMDRAGRL